MRSLLTSLAALSVLVLPAAPGQAREAPPAEVVVLGTLHRMHDEIPSYDFVQLERIIERLAPDVLCVELQPTDLETRPDEPNKQEYPRAIYPLIDRQRYRVYALEPAEPLFSQLLGPYVDASRRFADTQAEQSALFSAFVESTYAALKAYWKSPVEVNDELTDRVLRAKHDLQGALVGPGEIEGWERWNQHFLDVIETAALENPGRRVLVLVGAEHAYWLRAHLASSEHLRLVDTAKRLRELREIPDTRPEPITSQPLDDER